MKGAAHRNDVLTELFGDADVFLRDYWDQKPLHCQSQAKVSDLLSIDIVDELIASSVLYWPLQVRLAKDGGLVDEGSFTVPVQYPGMTNPPLVADPTAVVEQFLGGASILLQGMQRIVPSIGELCAALDAALTHPASASVFVAPPFAQGLGRHVDPYDVIVIQVQGSKHWDLHEPLMPHPIGGGPDERSDVGPPDVELVMAPGDVLYLPQGWFHSARALDEVSLHVSVMVANRRWVSLVQSVLADIDSEVDLRAALPAGFAHDPELLVEEFTAKLERLKAWLDTRDLGAVAREAAYDFWAERRPLRRHHLAQAMAAEVIDDSTQVRGRGGANLRVFEDATTVTLLLGERALTVPVAFAELFRRLAGGDLLRVAALADVVDEGLRLPIVRQLVREGFLEVIDDGLDGTV